MKPIVLVRVVLISILLFYISSHAQVIESSTIEIGPGASIDGGTGTDICANNKIISGTLSGTGTWCASSPLPVELTTFTASVTQNGVELLWTTATEVNNYGFEVQRFEVISQRSEIGGQWEKVGFVEGAGNSNSPKEYSFTDKTPVPGEIQYRLKQLDNDGTHKYSEVVSVKVELPKEFKLMQNSPNPFNPVTAINFQLPVNTIVTLKVYDILGREVATLLYEEKMAGSHIVYWNGKDNYGTAVSSGVYLYRITAEKFVETRKMNLLK